MKTVYENDFYAVKETGRVFDFIAVIENKKDNPIAVFLNDEDASESGLEPIPYLIPAHNWIGLFNVEYNDSHPQKRLLLEGKFSAIDIDETSLS